MARQPISKEEREQRKAERQKAAEVHAKMYWKDLDPNPPIAPFAYEFHVDSFRERLLGIAALRITKEELKIVAGGQESINRACVAYREALRKNIG